jgi:hypothetical protein
VASISGSSLATNLEKLIAEEYPKCMLTCTTQNAHEYPGIKKVHDLAKTVSEDAYILYFHSKGITRIQEPFVRDEWENKVYQGVIGNFENILYWMQRLPTVKKAGYWSAVTGMIWHNFWWGKVSYIRTVDVPEINSNRYYYEEWLSYAPHSTYSDCLAYDDLGRLSIGSFYDAHTGWHCGVGNANVVKIRTYLK